jgi:outer membrane receptor protein involved in Fe transport
MKETPGARWPVLRPASLAAISMVWALAPVGELGRAHAAAGAAASAGAPDSSVQDADQVVQEVVVRAERLGLIGTATTSSQGVVVDEELALTPAYRPGQLLETVPGLVVTSHSGEGKANQYLLRGFNLDHGTDLATFVDGMPVNSPTHAHGQGYTDLNFIIPELTTDLRFTKGPYFATEGDFASVGSVRLGYLDAIPDQLMLAAGTLGFQRLLGGGSIPLGDASLLGALELQHYDGPWVNPDDQRKVNAVLRYSAGDKAEGYSLTGMFYHGEWNATTDQPQRAITDGLISRFGSLDPSDGGESQRASLSAQWHTTLGLTLLSANAYVVASNLTLWNNFTHYLIDPVNGDQEAQHEGRRTFGGAFQFANRSELLGLGTEFLAGLQARGDDVDVERVPTRDRMTLTPADNPLGFSEMDTVHLLNLGMYAQATTYWTGWLRTVIGLREDYVHESDSGTNHGAADETLFQPKASIIFTPVDTTELYLSAGRGYHTDDARGVNQARLSGQAGAPLIAKSVGEEVGVRQQFGSNIAATLTLFHIDFQSETTYDPDVGMDSAGPGSRRYGVEFNLTYQLRRWLELYASIASTNARYTTPYDDGTGHVGTYIPNAPDMIASFAAYVKNLGPWSGGLEYRFLGAQPLTPDNAVKASGYGEWNADIKYSFGAGWQLGLGAYNLLNQHADAAAFWYIDRLPGEPAEGVADLHVHPLEPFSVRLSLGKLF